MTHSLRKPKYVTLPVADITPEGWLLNQLQIQAKGLAGHLHEFLPSVKHSVFLGGDQGGFDLAPYWLCGFSSLAYMLKDDALTATAVAITDHLITTQLETGWLGPEDCKSPTQQFPEIYPTANCDLWLQMLLLKHLVGYADASGDDRVADVVAESLRNLDRHIDSPSLRNWGMFRWFDILISICWLYEKRAEHWLLDLAVKMRGQGFGWSDFFRQWPYTGPTHGWSYMSHVVNNAMAPRRPCAGR